MITKPRKHNNYLLRYIDSLQDDSNSFNNLNFAELVIDSINLKIIITTISKEISVI